MQKPQSRPDRGFLEHSHRKKLLYFIHELRQP
jgi:hypothetical protein